MDNRAYSLLNVRSFDDAERVIEGIATTPSPDRMGDEVLPLGAKFALPMPLLHQHWHEKPVGHVEFAEPTEKGIPFRARIANIEEPGELQDRCNLAWQELKYGLVRAVSIGFRALEGGMERIATGWRFTEWEWLELSLVTVPAQSEATINLVKSIDRAMRDDEPKIPAIEPPAASGKKSRVVKLNTPARDGANPIVIRSIKRTLS